MKETGKGFIAACHRQRQTLVGKRKQSPIPLTKTSLPTLPEGWTWASLSELCERVSVGHVGPTSKFFCDKLEGVPFVRSQNVRPGKLDLDGVAHITQDFHNSLKKSQLRTGDILFVRVGANRGDCCVVPKGMNKVNCANIVFARPFFPNAFAGLFFRSAYGQKLLLSVTTGAAQGVLNTTSIAALPVPVPPLETQHKIDSILSAYDDLIENNTCRIKILEEIAQAIYREWFVNFRFPGHEKIKMVNSPLGEIPEGWEVKKLADVCSKVIDGTHDTPKPIDSGYPLVTGKHISDGFIDFRTCYSISKEDHEKVMKRSHPEKGDIIFSNIGTLGSTTIVDQDFEYSIKNVALFKPLNNNYSGFLFWHFSKKDTLKEMSQKASGTSQKFFSLGFLRAIELLVPSDEVIVNFSKTSDYILKLRSNLNKKNETLHQTRDLLLPKLISGDVDVSEVEVAT